MSSFTPSEIWWVRVRWRDSSLRRAAQYFSRLADVIFYYYCSRLLPPWGGTLSGGIIRHISYRKRPHNKRHFWKLINKVNIVSFLIKNHRAWLCCVVLSARRGVKHRWNKSLHRSSHHRLTPAYRRLLCGRILLRNVPFTSAKREKDY